MKEWLSYCLLFLCTITSLKEVDARMKMVEYLTSFFDTDRSPEHKGYLLLTEDPLDTDITYCAAPWGALQRAGRLHQIPNNNIGPAFTICEHDNLSIFLPKFKKMGINVVFACSSTKVEEINGIKIVNFPFAAIATIGPALKKDIFYTFIGAATHSSRRSIFAMNHSKNSIVKQRAKFHYYADSTLQEKYEQEYLDALARARFSLCPRGIGTSSFRFWESLKPGAIPVLISDSLRLPDWFDWDNCIVRVPENKVREIPHILAQITPKKEQEMRDNCYKAYRCFQEGNLVSVVRHYFDNEIIGC